MTDKNIPELQDAIDHFRDQDCNWTPVSWKAHAFKFTAFWNGMILAEPHSRERTAKWAGLNSMYTVYPILPARLERKGLSYKPPHTYADNGMNRQGWHDCNVPALWTEWSHDGILFEQTVFAHIPGAKDTVTGVEPLFLWMRLKIKKVCWDLPQDPEYAWVIKINKPFFIAEMEKGGHILDFEHSTYPRKLRVSGQYTASKGLNILEPNGTVRLGVAPDMNVRAMFVPRGSKALSGGPRTKDVFLTDLLDGKKDDRDNSLVMYVPLKDGGYVDVLIPAVPMDNKTFDAELKLGYNKAFKEANAYWAKTPKTDTKITTPDTFINEAIKQSMKQVEMIGEKNPDNGAYCIPGGVFPYNAVWSTATAIVHTWMLDTLGYHELSEKYFKVFIDEQGKNTAPGKFYTKHPGFFSTPKYITALDWITDHGAILWSIAEHAMLTGDERYIRENIDAIVKACEFIAYARRIKGHGGFEGIMPPAVASDMGTVIQGVWADGWTYKGLITAVRLLKTIGHPRANEFEREAADYKKTYVKLFRKVSATTRKWTDKNGKKHPFPPISLKGHQDWEVRHTFYYDCGPLFMVFAELLPASDPLMVSSLKWFREGPMREYFRKESTYLQVPVLDMEIGSAETAYNWNMFANMGLDDKHHFARGLFSLWAGGLSRQTFTSCETRHGMKSTVWGAAIASYMTKAAVIDERGKDGELHLMRYCPDSWVKPGAKGVFESVPTWFGPVSLRFKNTKGRLDIIFRPKFRDLPKKTVLHIDFPKELVKQVWLNGIKIN